MGIRRNPTPFPASNGPTRFPPNTFTMNRQSGSLIRGRRITINPSIAEDELVNLVEQSLQIGGSDMNIEDVIQGPSRTRRTSISASSSRSPISRTARNNPGGSNTQARALKRLQRQAQTQTNVTTSGPSRARPGSREGSESNGSVNGRSSNSRGRRGRSQDRSITLFNIGAGQPNERRTNSSSSRTNIVDGSRRRRVRTRLRSISLDLTKVLQLSAQYKVMHTEKFLKKILSYLTWNELLRKRRVCRKWEDTISNEASLQPEMSKVVICMKQNFADGFRVFNNSKKVWTQFRIEANVVFDLTQTVQSEFWLKHGSKMTFLELRNSSLTIASFVEILVKTTNLESLTITWTPEMYSFNADMIKRYYGVAFRNSTFQKMQNLKIEHCSALTDNALWSILRWCGSSVSSIALTSSFSEKQVNLARLKPRWTLQPIDDFATRFGYSGNLKFLDFSGSNMAQLDLTKLGNIDKLTHLTGIRLSNCNISDEGLSNFLSRRGHKLEELYIDHTNISETVFQPKSKDLQLPKLKVLNISGTRNFSSLTFLHDLTKLTDFYCSNTTWLNKHIITQTIQPIRSWKQLDLGFNEMSDLKIKDSDLKNTWFHSFTTAQNQLSEIHLNFWGIGNDSSFKSICKNLLNLRKLSVRGWKISDEGVTGISTEELANYELKASYAKLSKIKKVTKSIIGNLKRLEVLDIGKCENLTDSTINSGLVHLTNLREVSLDYTQVTDSGIQLLISNSNALSQINAEGCERVTVPIDNKINRPDETVVFFANRTVG